MQDLDERLYGGRLPLPLRVGVYTGGPGSDRIYAATRRPTLGGFSQNVGLPAHG
ncbi:hypothetical protein ACFV1U_32575 [Streptomyces microflavus]|uniref:hypothetical protein n=1 Tax=Streptomyces microflavus TaxID=1919 RepID=UPI0036ACC639